jgi:hybrid cluster-associated redox disulfide protein
LTYNIYCVTIVFAEWQKKKRRFNAMEITKNTTMGDMLEYDRGIGVVLMEAGMHCVGCPASIGETLEEACQVHGLDSDVVLKSITDYLATK